MKNLWRHLVSIVALVACTLSSAGTITYYHNDIAGSPIAATNESGAVLWRESYRPYGERLTNAPASTPNDVWFTSRRQDVDTGLVYMGARYYDPVIGRFMSTDPVGLDEANLHSFNRYAYANNNPLKYKDPDGRSPLSVLARCAGAPASCITPFAQAAQSAYARVQVMVGNAVTSAPGQVAVDVAAAEAGTPRVPSILASALAQGVAEAEKGVLRQLVHKEDDLTFLFRRDFGQFARGDEPHWNIQVMSGKGKDAEISNIHVYVDGAGSPVRAVDSKGVWNDGKMYEFSKADQIPR